MDLNMLLFIAGQGRVGMPQASKRQPNAPPRPYYKCGNFDHWAKDCPSPQQPRPNQNLPAIMALTRYCLDYGIKHFVLDCQLNPRSKVKAPLNSIEVIPFTNTMPTLSGEESEEVKLLKVVTRA